MTPPFRYVDLSSELITELVGRLEAGDSAVIISPPEGGKGFLRRSLKERLLKAGYGPVVSINYRGHASDSASARCLLERRIVAEDLVPGSGEGLFGPLEGLPPNVILFVANPDTLPYSVSRQLLQQLRSRVDGDRDRLCAMVCGERDLSELVHGPASEFNVAHQYVLQGLSRETFTSDYLNGYEKELTAKFTPATRDRLFKLTGGSGDQCRALLIAFVEKRVRSRRRHNPEDLFDVQQVDELIAHLQEFGVSDRYFLRNLLRFLPTEPNLRVFENLQRLINEDSASLDQPAGPPGTLTLSGVAIRENGLLKFSSQLMKEAAGRFFTPLRMAHLHAQAGRFDQAWARSTSPPSPAYGQDLTALMATVRAAGAEAYRCALESRMTLWTFMANVLKKLVGVKEVSFWEQRHAQDSWHSCLPGATTQEMAGVCQDVLRLDCVDQNTGSMVVPGVPAGSLLAWSLKSVHEGGAFAVFVGDPTGQQLIPKAVENLIKDFATHFRDAHDRAVEKEEAKRRSAFLSVQLEVLERLQGKFADGEPKINEILAETRALLPLGYHRIAFALCDAADRKIYEVFDAAKQQLLGYGPWPIDPTTSPNVHSVVFNTKEPVFINKAEGHGLTTETAVREGKIGAMAVCPIISGSEVIGTIHIERDDRLLPFKGEVDDFLRFGRNLGLLITQSNRLHLIQGTLNGAREGLVIYNHRQEAIYADRRAAELFKFREGWSGGTPADRGVRREQRAILSQFAAFGFREGRNVELMNPFHDTDMILSLQADVLSGWRGQPVASYLSALDLTEEYGLFKALNIFSLATDFETGLKRLIEAIRLLGYPSARIYLERGGELTSTKHFFGFSDREREKAFQVTLAGEDSWRCLNDRELIVFCRKASAGKFRTGLGLMVQGTTQTNAYPVEKELDQYWLEAPLIADDKAIGKVSIDCDLSLRPERVDFLRAFFSLASRLLEALSRARREAFKLSMAELSHNLFTQVTWLDREIFLYRRHERRWEPELLRSDTDRLEAGLKRITQSLARAKSAFSLKRPNYKTFKLIPLLAEVFPSEVTTIDATDPALDMDGDEVQLAEIFQELISNAESFSPNCLRLWVVVRTAQIASGEWVSIEVRDNGPGFPAHLRNDDAFEAFITHRQEKQPPGTGLGLAIVKQRVALHGGLVEILPGDGARLRIRLPRWRKSVTEVPNL